MEDNIKYKLICEVCGREQIYDSLEDAFNDGWDYPPYIGAFGVLSSRICPHCTIDKTTWWKVQTHDTLNRHDLEVIDRIKNEPVSLIIREE